MKILALDIATTTGWALGDSSDKIPEFGSVCFASARGVSHASIFARALRWASEQFKIWQPDRVVIEAPLQWRGGASRAGNDELLHGLPAVLTAVAYLRGTVDIRKAETRAVRMHFLGENPKREIAKRKTIARCRMIGWNVADDNAADACAIWSYACGLLKVEASIRPKPLWFNQESKNLEPL